MPKKRVTRILDEFERAIVKVRTLKTPDDIVDRADRLVDLAHQQRDVIGELIDAAKDSDLAKVRELDFPKE